MEVLIMKRIIIIFIFLLQGCSMFNSQKFDTTYAEQQAGYGYIPVEPSPVQIYCPENGNIKENNCGTVSKRSLLNALPDNSVRIATRQISGSVDAGIPVIGTSIGVKGNSYEVIIDFVNTQTVNRQFVGKWRVTIPDTVSKLNRCYPMERPVLEIVSIDKYENWSLRAELLQDDQYQGESYRSARSVFDQAEMGKFEWNTLKVRCPDGSANIPSTYNEIQVSSERFNIPVYYGIGLRLKANITVNEGSVNLSSLPALTAAVSAGTATGTMSVQTIGISGKAASNLLLLDKIDSTTIQNAIQVLASIKASIGTSDTTISPRIVGFHNTIGAGTQGVNLIHSLLAGGDHYLSIESDAFAEGNMSD
jgi:hypothetical protein